MNVGAAMIIFIDSNEFFFLLYLIGPSCCCVVNVLSKRSYSSYGVTRVSHSHRVLVDSDRDQI